MPLSRRCLGESIPGWHGIHGAFARGMERPLMTSGVDLMRTFRLVIACPDRVGIVAKVSNLLATYNGLSTEANHGSDHLSGWCCSRHEIRSASLPFDADGLRTVFAPIAAEYEMAWQVSDSAERKKVGLMASRESHC